MYAYDFKNPKKYRQRRPSYGVFPREDEPAAWWHMISVKRFHCGGADSPSPEQTRIPGMDLPSLSSCF